MAEKGPLPETGITVGYPTVPSYATGPSFGEGPWFRLVFVLVIALAIIGVVYLTYRWFGRDLIILFRAKRQRSTEEIGFGNTPARADARVNQPAAAANLAAAPGVY